MLFFAGITGAHGSPKKWAKKFKQRNLKTNIDVLPSKNQMLCEYCTLVIIN